MAVNEQELERTTRQFSLGGGISGGLGGFAAGGPVGAALGAAAGAFGGSSQPVQKPFDIKVQKPSPGTQSAYMTGMFGTQGNYNPDALLPTGQKTNGFNFQNPFGGQNFQQFAGGGQSPQGGANNAQPQQQQGPQSNLMYQQQPQQGFDGNQAFTSMFNDPNYRLSYGAQDPSMQGQPTNGGKGSYGNVQNNAVPQSSQDAQNPYGGYTSIPFNNKNKDGSNKGLQQNVAAAQAAGNQPFIDQLNMQSAGTANLGLGFQNIQNAQNASGQLVSQGANYVNQGQQSYDQGAGNLQNTIGQNNQQFQNQFSGLQNSTNQANAYNQQAAGYAGYSPETIKRAYGFADTAGQLAQGAMDDKGLARNILTDDIGQRTNLINQGLSTGIDATTQQIADQIRNSTMNSFNSNLNGGALGDQLNQRFATAQSNAASRGLGNGSSPVLQAGVEVEKERARLLNDATNQANNAYNNTLLTTRGQQQQNTLQGAGLLNQSAMNSLNQFAPLINAGSGAVGAGTGALNAATNAQQTGASILNNAAQTQNQTQGQQIAAGNLLLQGQGQQQGAMQNLLNSGIAQNQNAIGGINSMSGQALQAGQLGVSQGQLGLGTQGQGYDQVLAMLQALQQQQNNSQNVNIQKGAAAAGTSSS